MGTFFCPHCLPYHSDMAQPRNNVHCWPRACPPLGKQGQQTEGVWRAKNGTFTHLHSRPDQAEARRQGLKEPSPRRGKSVMLGLTRGMAGQAELGKA